MATWKISSEIEPNYAGGLMRAKWLIGGVRTVKTLTQRNAIPALYRYFSAEESTIVFVEDESQLYRLNNNPSGVTTNADWTLISFGNVSSALTPIGTWNIDNTTPVLSDAGASGLNGNFYFVAGAPTPVEVTISGLFEGEPVTLVDGNMIISVGTRWVVVSNSTAWNSIDKPQSIIDYVAGTVIAHTHTVADISDLGSYLTNYLTRSDVADPDIDFEAVPDSDIISSEFIKKYYYRKTEVDDALSSFAQSFLELTDTPSSYSGFASKLVQVNATGTALEFVDPPATDLTSVLAEGNDAGGVEIINLGLGTQPTSALRRTDILDVSGILKTSLMPASVMERVYVYAGVETLPENAGLTTTQVQNGDVVKINSTGLMYVVVDDTQLNLALGYTVFSAGSAASVPWSGVTGTPTTLAGYGITDPIALTSGSYADPAWITSLAWSKLTGTPTTLAGYGITNAWYSDGPTTLTANNLISTGDFTLTFERASGDALSWTPARRLLSGGVGISFSGAGLTPAGGGKSIFIGEAMTITADHSWSAVFGDVYTLDAIFNNGLMAGTGHNLSGGPIGSGQVFGNGNILSGESYKLHDLIAGSGHTYNTTGIGIPNASSGNFMFGKSNTISGTLITNSFAGGSLSQVSAAGAFAYGYPIAAQTTRPIISSGVHSFNFSANSISQGLGHGALANYSVILGGQDHHVPSDSPGTVILGGNGIKARAASSNWTYTTNFHGLGSILLSSDITHTPTANTTLDVRGVTGNNIFRLASAATNTELFLVKDNGVLTHTSSITSGFGAIFSSNSGGDVDIMNITDSFTHSSGSFHWVGLRVNPTINSSGTHTGSVIGIDYNPTMTSYVGTGHTGLRVTSGNIIFGTTIADTSSRITAHGIAGGKIVNLRDVTGLSRFTIDDTGLTTLTGNAGGVGLEIKATGHVGTMALEITSGQTGNIFFNQWGNITYQLSTSANTGINFFNVVSFTGTTGTQGDVSMGSTYEPASGSGAYTVLHLKPTINTTGTYAGTVTGLDYNPTLTSTTGAVHNAARFRSGDVRLNTGNIYLEGTTSKLSFGGVYNHGVWAAGSQNFIMSVQGVTIFNANGATMIGNGSPSLPRGVLITALGASYPAAIIRGTDAQTESILKVQTVGGVNLFTISPTGRSIFGGGTATAKIHVVGEGTTTGELLRLDSLTPANKLLVLDNGTGTVNGNWNWETGILSVGGVGPATTKLYSKGADNTGVNYAAIFENSLGEAIAKFRNDLSLELFGTSAILEVNDGIESGNAAIRFLTFESGVGLGFRFQDKNFNDYLNFRSILTDRALVVRQTVEYDFNQGEKRIEKQYTVTTDTTASAHTVIFEFTLADLEHYDIKVLHAEATASDATSITSLGVDCADVRKIAATNIEGNTSIATQSRLPSSVVSGSFNWNLDTVNQKLQYRFQNLSGTGKEFVVWCDISFVKRLTPVTG